MERTLSSEEKIRRAEEIYARRKNGYVTQKVAKVNAGEKKNYGLLKRMVLQIIICLVIYLIFYLIQNGNYVFSQDVINKTKEILSYNINLEEIYSGVISGINNLNQGIYDGGNTINEITNTVNDSITTNTLNEINELQEDIDVNAIGGGDVEDAVLQTVANVDGSANVQQDEVNQVEEIAVEPKEQTTEEYIKANFSFIKPVEGIVSSEFGLRDDENPIVSKNHIGIDIAANTGTVINAAMEGTVTISSKTGSYGYHIKITNNDVSTLYAHCNKLYVKEGEEIKQGQKIAEVGSTGKSTGPHLHFEVMRGDVYINPREVIDF